MRKRTELHEKLVKILGSKNVYFEPPESIKMKYPCIVYERGRGDSYFADNKTYLMNLRYNVTVIDKDVDSEIYKKIAYELNATYDRRYAVDNLNHDFLTLYY